MMLVPQAPCLTDIVSPNSVSVCMYSPELPPLRHEDLDAPVVSWSYDQVSRWLRQVLVDQDVPYSEVQHAAFVLGSLSGPALLSLTEQDLGERTGNLRLAEIVFCALQRRLKAEAIGDENLLSTSVTPLETSPASSPSSVRSCDTLTEQLLNFTNVLDSVLCTPPVYHEMEPVARPTLQCQSNQNVPSWIDSITLPESLAQMTQPSPAPSRAFSDNDLVFRLGNFMQLHKSSPDGTVCNNGTCEPEDSLPSILCDPGPCAGPAPSEQPPANHRRPGGRPKGPKSQLKKSTGQRRPGGPGGATQPLKGRLWQFLVRLLNDPLHNPSIIRWENQDEGVFAFVQGQRVAELWGEAKANSNMNYEKMSRTMRTYKNRAFEAHPRRLHYKFGEKAKWRDLVIPRSLPIGVGA